MASDQRMVTGRDGDALIRRVSDFSRTPEERGADAYELLQELFHGYPISHLSVLLRSDDSATVEAGIWVLSELGSRAAPLLGEVEPLLRSGSRKVRYWAIDVVHSSAGPEDGRIIGKALGLLDDGDIAVRRAALHFLGRAAESQLSAAIEEYGDSELGRLLVWLRGVTDDPDAASEIMRMLQCGDRLTRMVAVAAAARISSRDKSALEWAAAEGDEEISVFASREMG